MFCSSHDKQTFPATTTQSHARLQKDMLRLRTKQKLEPWKWIALNTINSMPRQLHPRGTSWEAGQLQSSDLTLTPQTTNVRPHTQWTKTYSWRHKFVHDCFMFYWLVVFLCFFVQSYVTCLLQYMSVWYIEFVDLCWLLCKVRCLYCRMLFSWVRSGCTAVHTW